MRSVRCEVCGAKALTAASKCPTCGHLFELRDGFGKLLPLTYCSSCDSYYSESHGSCRWCGTKPEPAPMALHVWKSIGIVAFVALAFGVWLVRRDGWSDATHAPGIPQAQPDSPSVPTDTVVSPVTLTSADSAALSRTIESAGSVAAVSAMTRDTTSGVPTDSIVQQTAPRSVAPPKPQDKPSAKLPATRSSTSRTSSRWVNSVSRDWVVVRADASKGARIVASVGPNSRVQLGETRGSWRRIRARGLAGWVEDGSFSAR